jgi:hypothetical protein
VKVYLRTRRYHLRVGDDAVDRVIANGTGKAHVMDLDRSRSLREDAQPASQGVALAFDQ